MGGPAQPAVAVVPVSDHTQPHGAFMCDMKGLPHAGPCDDVRPLDEPETCPFCEIVAGRAPATIVGDWNEAMAIVPLNPVTAGHVIVIPKRHVENATTSPLITGKTALIAANVGMRTGGAFNLITSVGAPATQTVMHLHWHVVPRVEGDGLHLPWTGQAETERRAAEMVADATRFKVDEAAIGAQVDEMAPEGGWWHSTTPETLERVLGDLVGRGMPLEAAVNAVEWVMTATRDEYGE